MACCWTPIEARVEGGGHTKGVHNYCDFYCYTTRTLMDWLCWQPCLGRWLRRSLPNLNRGALDQHQLLGFVPTTWRRWIGSRPGSYFVVTTGCFVMENYGGSELIWQHCWWELYWYWSLHLFMALKKLLLWNCSKITNSNLLKINLNNSQSNHNFKLLRSNFSTRKRLALLLTFPTA